MKRFRTLILALLVIVSGLGAAGCKATYYKVPVVKSRKHFRPYDSKRDRGRERVRVKKYKSLKQTRYFKKLKLFKKSDED